MILAGDGKEGDRDSISNLFLPFRVPRRRIAFKRATVYAENVSFVILVFVGVVAALLTYPWTTLVLVDFAYLGAIGYTFLRKPATVEPAED